ncbi:uncharacterized protein LOC143576558 [Bidens hawaiensis]|uniref:uncharacterized protein LOC143576558 n=1 Tax=Bidens hawaiensis TaxID=980011 RepID=UPI00404A3F7E
MNSKVRIVKCPRCRRVLAEPSDVPVYACGGCGAKLQAKKRINSTVDTTSQNPDEHEKLKLDRAFGDHEASSSSNKQCVLNSTNKSDQKDDYNDLLSSNKDQEATKDAVNEYSSETLKIKQLSNDQEPCSSSNQRVVNSSDEHEPDQIIHNEPRSSTEFSGHEDPESSPEATPHNIIEQEHEHGQAHYQNENIKVLGLEHSSSKEQSEQLSDNNETDTESSPNATPHNIIKQEHEQEHEHEQEQEQYQNENITVVQLEDPSSKQQFEQLSDNNETDTESLPEDTAYNNVNRHETEFVSCRNDTGVEESDSEFDEVVANTRVVSDSDGGSKSSFKNMIAEKLLDTRQKKPVYLDEDELLSEDGSADLRHRKRLGRFSSVESMETARLAGTSYYGYEGSVSSFDGTDDQGRGKKHIGSIRDEHVDSGNWYRFNRRSEFKDNHRSLYSLNEFHENPRHRSPMIPENPKMERIELLKLVQELQDQLERSNISNTNPNLQQVPSYYNHVLNNVGRYGQRMAFSGEATAVNRRRDAGSCHHCCPQDRHFSAQLPRQHVCCNGPSCGPSYGPNTYHSQQFSSPSSPKHNHSVSEFSAPDDHWQPNEVMKPKKKKQYVRPIAGGSPWIACYRCFELLQLPQSFLLFNKRYHSIRCGSCMKVLNFTLTNGTHVSRYYPEEMIAAPPSSEAEDFDKLTGPWAGPVSCSDRSFEKSYSTETDRNGSREFSEDRRKATMSRDPSGSTRPPSSRVSGRRTTTSEIEEVEPEHRSGPNGSPLHWLMGYASPSKVIQGL